MMENTLASLGYGEGRCPHCHSAFEVNQNAVRFFARHYGDAVLFMLCPACASVYDCCNKQERSNLQYVCLDNIKNHPGSRNQFACITLLTVAINHGDYAAALENGIGSMDRSTYELLIRSDEALIFSNCALVYWERLPESLPILDISASSDGHDLH